MLSEFIDMVVNGKWGHTSEDWNEIVGEYSDLIKSTDSAQILSLRKDITILSNKCMIVEAVVNSIEVRDNPELWAVLRRMGLSGKTLDIVKSQAKRFVSELTDKQGLLSKFVSDKKTTEADFNEKLAVLSKFQGYRVDKNTTSIAEYCAVSNQYTDYCKAMEAQAEAAKGKTNIRK